MTPPTFSPEHPFDHYATDYEQALMRGLSVSGENREFFARGRVSWLAKRLQERLTRVRRVIDFGCGTGETTPLLHEHLAPEEVVGVEASAASLEVARQKHASPKTRFLSLDAPLEPGSFDLVYCNGVFHHIPPGERAGVIRHLAQALRPGGFFALFENNPYNPGTRYVMSRIPFDKDAILLSPREAKRLLAEGGFTTERVEYLFIFPRFLRFFRPLEPLLARLPLGAQYLVLGQKPQSAPATC